MGAGRPKKLDCWSSSCEAACASSSDDFSFTPSSSSAASFAAAAAARCAAAAAYAAEQAIEEEFGLADGDLTMGERNGVEARRAGLIDRCRRHRERNAALERSLSGGHLPGAALHDLTHVGEVNVLAGHTGSFQRRFDREAAEVGAAERCERARWADSLPPA